MGVKKVVIIRQALQHVVDKPTVSTDVMLDIPAHELVCRTLFEIANGATINDPRTQSRANVARKLIFERLVGRRKTGTHPAKRRAVSLEFRDLTAGELEDE